MPNEAIIIAKKAKVLVKKSSDLLKHAHLDLNFSYMYYKSKVVLALAFLKVDDITSARSEILPLSQLNFPSCQLQILLNLQYNHVLAQLFVKHCHLNPGCNVPEFYKCPDEARIYCLRGINQLTQLVFPSLSKHSVYSFSSNVGSVEFGRQSKIFRKLLFIILHTKTCK